MFARLMAVVATSMLSLTVGSAAHAAQDGSVEPGTLDGGGPSQTGWWTTSNEPPPDNGVAPPPTASEPTVPEGSLPVAAVLGEPQKASAIEFALEGPPDSMVDSVLLSLRESTQNGLTVGGDEAVILACPITDAFWVGEEAGPWKRRPAFDCDAGAATGVRDKDGVWSFDLTGLAADWLSTARIASPGVMLVSGPTAEDAQPASFQVTFDGIAAEGIGLVADTTPPRNEPGLPVSGPESPASTGGGSVGTGSTGGTGSADLGGDLGGSAPVADSGGAPLDAGSAPDAGATPISEEAPIAAGAETEPVSASPLATPSSWYSGLGAPSILLLLLGLGLAYAVMLALGPNAQPVGTSGRRGVSRALDRLAAARGTVTAKWSRS